MLFKAIKQLENDFVSTRKYLELLAIEKESNKSIIINSDIEIISLGDNCIPRNVLTRFGLKKTKLEGELTCPFDLAIHPATSVAQFLKNDFKQYLDISNLSIDFGHPVNNKYKVMFNHEREQRFRDNDFDELIKRYELRVKNFKNLINSNKHILFVLHTKSRNGLEELVHALSNIVNPDKSVLLIANSSSIPIDKLFATTTNLRVEILNNPEPYNGYTWFSTKDYSSNEGYNYEKNIVDKARSIIESYFIKNQIKTIPDKHITC